MPECNMDDVKKQLTQEVKQLAKNTQQICKKAEPLREEAAELDKNKKPSPEEKKRLLDVRKELEKLQLAQQSEADKTSERINRMLKEKLPDEDQVPDWQKKMAPWYRDLINKEPGLDLGKGLKLKGDISITEKKVEFSISGKF